MASHTTAYDEMDDLTAQMCITLQLEDIASAMEVRASTASPPSDEDVALQIQQTDLKVYRILRGFEEPPAEPPAPPHLPIEEKKKKQSEDVPEQPLPVDIALFDCAACSDRFNAEQCTKVPCDEHYYCDACLEELFALAIHDRTLYPPRCCRQPIPWETVRDLMSEDLVSQFEAKREELDDQDPVYCHDKHCAAYIPVAEIEEETHAAECSMCHEKTCTLCKQGVHADAAACPEDEEVQKMRAYAKEEGNQECSQCHQLVELAVGCNHITCICHHEFCYICGLVWKTCPCEQWDEARLMARAEDVAHRPGMGGGEAAPAIAERLRRNHRDCDEEGHGYMDKINEAGISCDGCGEMQWKFIFRCRHCHVELCYRCKNHRA